MSKYKTFVGILIAMVLVSIQAVSAQAANFSQTGVITGTIQSISTLTDSSGNTIVLVTLTDPMGTTQTERLSLDTAITLGLVTRSPDGNIIVNDVVGQSTSIDTTSILVDPCKSSGGNEQFVGKALANFFCSSIGLDYNTVNGYHIDGFGYGEIAQACFMAQALGGDAALCGSILTAKKTGDFSSLVLPDGVTATNWGQLKKDVLSQEVKSLTNLGAIVSGRASNSSNNTNTGDTNINGSQPNPNVGGNGNEHGHGNGNGNGSGHGQGKGH
jgi:hypothetical protein